MISGRALAIGVFTVAACITSVLAQDAMTGTPPFGTFEVGKFDTVNLQNLNFMFSIPIASVPGRGINTTVALHFNQSIWRLGLNSSSPSGLGWQLAEGLLRQPLTTYAPGWNFGQLIPYVRYDNQAKTCAIKGGSASYNVLTNYAIVEPDGTTHPFPESLVITFGSPGPSADGPCPKNTTGTVSVFAQDGSGFRIDVVTNSGGGAPGPPTGYSPSGLKINSSSVTNPPILQTGSLEDVNGNTLTGIQVNSNEVDWTDTLGRTVVKISTVLRSDGSPSQYQYQTPNTNGGYNTTTISLQEFSLKTNFACPQGHLEGSANGTLPTTIALANSKSYTFTYEPTPGNSSFTTGRIQTVTLPTGATYQYSYPGANDGVTCVPESGPTGGNLLTHFDQTNSLTRTISGAASTLTESYAWVRQDASDVQTTINVSAFPADPEVTTKRVFKTSSTVTNNATTDQSFDSSGTNVLRTVVTTKNATSGFLISQITLLEDGLTQSESDYSFGTGGVLLSQSDYDFGNGAHGPLLRSVNKTYLSGPAYTTKNVLDRVVDTIMSDSLGHTVARTHNDYDQNAFTTCPTGVPGHDDSVPCSDLARGNITTFTRYLDPFTPGQAIARQRHYDWFGNLVQADEDCCTEENWDFSATTQYGYPDSIVKGPANGPQLTTGLVYNFATGLVTTRKDENGQPSTYQYNDPLNRPTNVSFADGGSTTYTYDDTNLLVTETQAVGNGVSPRTTVSSYDPLGQLIQTRLTSDPLGTDFVDTVYDALGRVVSVSNPHRSTAFPTDGVAQTQHDALGRVTQATEQDGSVTTVSYSLNCATVTDEAGKQRKSCVDGLGRLLEVDEPLAADIAVPGSGGGNPTASVPISGELGLVASSDPPEVASATTIVMRAQGAWDYIDSNGDVHELWCCWDSHWSSPDITAVIGAPKAESGSPLSAYTDASGNVSILYINASQHLEILQYASSNGNWTATDITAQQAANGVANPAAWTPLAMRAQGAWDYIDVNGDFRELWCCWNGGWSSPDITYWTGGKAESGSPMSSYTDASGNVSVLYINASQHLEIQQYTNSTGKWTATDITAQQAANGVADPASWTPLAMRGQGAWDYIDVNGDFRELWCCWNGGWSSPDITYWTGGKAESGSPMSSYTDASGNVSVLYINASQHLEIQQYSSSNGNWTATDITAQQAANGVANPASWTPLLMRAQGAWDYIDVNGDLRELWCCWNGGWSSPDITYVTGAPKAMARTPISGYTDSSGNVSLLYVNSSQEVEQLAYASSTGSWTISDLSVLASAIYDSGTVSLTVGGFTVTACYGWSTNPACSGQINGSPQQVAAALAQALNVAASPVTATVSGSTLNLTWKSAAPSNTQISGLTTTHDQPSLFAAPSFIDAYVTLYTYDSQGNLLRVDQKGSAPADSTQWRTRTFAYDALSRLLTATNPESGVISYSYDTNGNLIAKTAPAPNQTGAATVTTNYTYDGLSRLTQRSYSDGSTPTANFLYDTPAGWGNPTLTQTNLIGRLSEEWTVSPSGVTGSGTAFSYDAMGRGTANNQCTPFNCGSGNFALAYAYDFIGDVTSYTTGVGVVFSQGFNSAGRVTQLTSSASDAQHPGTLATPDPSVGYYPNGSLRKVTYGNGLTETAAFNNRLQPCRLNVNSSGSALLNCGDAVPSGNVQDFAYGFNAGSADNGNLASFAASGAQNFSRSYGYDGLNRLQTLSAPGDSCSGLNWTYDPWSNRLAQSTTGGSCNSFQAPVNTGNQLSGAPYQYDAAGNLTNDGSHTYTYDADNRITQVDGGSTATYSYDAAGRRVEKIAASVKTDYLYDLAGNVVTEYNNVCAPVCWATSYIYLRGELVAEYKNATTYFVHKDHLASTRLLTKLDQTLEDSMDYLPYGEQIAGDTGTTHKFTGKERDSESGLDDFGSRYYESAAARFTSVDPVVIAPERIRDPQELNRYAYVRNNPLRFIDPTGEVLKLSGDLVQDQATLCAIAGLTDCSRITVDSQTGVVSFNAQGLDLSQNEGAMLLNQLVTSSNVYGFALSDTVATQGGDVKLTGDRTTANLDTQPDERYGKGKTPTDLPPKGVNDQVTIDPKTATYTDSQGRPVSIASLSFHELAEAYAKIDGSKIYSDFVNINIVNGTTLQVGTNVQQGAHNEAVQRELNLREQRPNLKSGGRAGDQLIRVPHN